MSPDDRSESPALVALGRIVRAQGLNGAVRVLPYGVAPEVSARLMGKSVILRLARARAAPRVAVLEDERWQNGVWIVRLSGCSTRTEAEALVGCDLCLSEEDRPPLERDEYYPDQLVGLAVLDAHTGETLGTVAAVQPAAAADLLEVQQPEGGRFLIPLVHALIRDVDLSSRTIRVDLPEGLMDL